MAAWQVSSNSFKDQSWFQEELQIVELKVAEYIIADKEQNQLLISSTPVFKQLSQKTGRCICCIRLGKH
ncbi:hypothetical protein GOP47_0016681 [Adiantum capillus-veneris]|uniref:Uncharacterized protein n=1 Tax=Adiantum capillus-veneris TaxID=13818 RepID=A0A9D4ZD77_ADICA|nr:hypothetical protein GOP47_0016681 [Adiantum capillus-veneris]